MTKGATSAAAPFASRRARILAILAAVPLALVSFMDSSLAIARRNAPAFLLLKSPDDPYLATGALQAGLMETQTPSPQLQADARRIARLSLRDHALNPEALRLLGSAAPLGSAEAENYLDLSIAMTRRDEIAQLLKAASEARRGDLPKAMRHFDTAIRTSRASRPLIYPILARGLGDPSLRGEFDVMLAARPQWMPEFLYFLAMEYEDPGIASQIFADTRTMPQTEEYIQLRQDLLVRLADLNRYRDAATVFSRLPGGNPAVLRSPELTPALLSERNGAFGWRFFSGASIGAVPVVRNGTASVIDVFAASGEQDVVAGKVLFLDAGSFALSFQLLEPTIPQGAAARIGIECLAENAWTSLALRALDSGTPAGEIRLSFNLPTNCDIQRIVVSAAGASGVEELMLGIGKIRLVER